MDVHILIHMFAKTWLVADTIEFEISRKIMCSCVLMYTPGKLLIDLEYDSSNWFLHFSCETVANRTVNQYAINTFNNNSCALNAQQRKHLYPCSEVHQVRLYLFISGRPIQLCMLPINNTVRNFFTIVSKIFMNYIISKEICYYHWNLHCIFGEIGT